MQGHARKFVLVPSDQKDRTLPLSLLHNQLYPGSNPGKKLYLAYTLEFISLDQCFFAFKFQKVPCELPAILILEKLIWPALYVSLTGKMFHFCP